MESASLFWKLGVQLSLVFLILITIQSIEARRPSYGDDDSDSYANRESDCDSDFRTSDTNRSEEHQEWQPPTPSPRIVNGRVASPGQYPFVVRIEIKLKTKRTAICTGSIIDSRTVLTAAHCVLEHKQKLAIRNPATIRVVAGDHRRGGNSGHATYYKTARISIHSYYKTGSDYTINDIAVIITKDKIKLKPGDARGYGKVDIVKLPQGSNSGLAALPNWDVIVAGWGLVRPGDDSSEAPQLMALETKTATCSDTRVTSVINKQSICVPFAGTRGACHGDSGGPLFVQPPADDNGRPRKAIQYGITSFIPGGKCGKAMSYFVDVSKYTFWIKDAIKNTKSNLIMTRE